MGLLDRGMAMLNRRLGQAAGTAVTYTRGATVVPLDDALVGRTAFVSNQQNAARVEWGDRDYLIPVASLVALGEPADGDRIGETVNGTALVFEVMTPSTGEPAWRYSDATRTVFRVHTKQVA